jgi:hypothetical protein
VIETVKIERKGANVLVLSKLDTPRKLHSGSKTFHYVLQYRWLVNETCDAFGMNSRVLGTEDTYWTRGEVAAVLSGKATLFETFNLF